MWYYVILSIIVLTIGYVVFNFFKVRAMKEGTAEMSEMAGIIRGNSFVKGKLRRFLRNWTVKSFRLSQTTSSKEIYFRKSSPEE